jgi:hypothetical protein
MAAISTTNAAAQMAFVGRRVAIVARDGKFSFFFFSPARFLFPKAPPSIIWFIYLLVEESETNKPGDTAVRKDLDVATKAG